MSRSGLLGYHSGRGLLLLGVALTVTAQDGGTFSLLLVGGRARRASGLTATAPGGDVVLLIKNPPPEGSASAALPPEFLTSGILEIFRFLPLQPPARESYPLPQIYDLLGSSPIPSDPGPAATTNSPTIESPNYGGIDP